MVHFCFIFSWHENNVIHSLKVVLLVGVVRNISHYKRDVIPLPVEKFKKHHEQQDQRWNFGEREKGQVFLVFNFISDA